MACPESPAGAAGTAPFSQRVQRCFGRQAAAYEHQAPLQAAVAHRLARLLQPLAAQLPAGACADLGAGSGLLARAIEARSAVRPLLRLDSCAALLAEDRRRDPPPPQRLWDLNLGLPSELDGAALLASSFALQWLEQPQLQLQRWCCALAPAGVLALALPCAGSLQVWRQAAQRAAVPFTGLPLPEASPLIALAAERLDLQQARPLRFSRPNRGAWELLRQIKAIGAQASRGPRLTRPQLQALARHWPGPQQPIIWEVLVLVGRKR